ncbi:MgtC/SapB family protein [Ferviditalea candida]|uniref:MgtC/SapB family protein n=1 Tax=Ferviditalea candida TaxID=3108399 RepID=A0ABU5ZJV2_9BACL|nr:MgtC/SapB family protein [Paenibacillaceae bacterium T2]
MAESLHSGIWEISYIELTLRLVLAAVLGGLIGLEREFGYHPAGFRTHILVCLGSALIMILSIYGFTQFAAESNVRMDPARLAAQVISGVGFLGAGTILRTGVSITGLTTAASLWVVSAIGLSVGAGFYFGSVLVTVMVLFSLFLLNKLEKSFSQTKKFREIRIQIPDGSTALNVTLAKIAEFGLSIHKIQIENPIVGTEAEERVVTVRLLVKAGKPAHFQKVLLALPGIPGVRNVECE